jgi:outer membrane protein TolC
MRYLTITIFIITALLLSTAAFSDEISKKNTQAQLEGPQDITPVSKTTFLTLDECVDRALKNSARIASERFKLVSLEEQKKAALWEPFSHFYLNGKFSVVPNKCSEITAAGGLQSCDGSALPEDSFYKTNWGPTFHLEFKGGIPIPVSNKMFSGKKALEEGIKAKESMLPTLENEIRFNVHRAFYAISGAREMLYTLSEGRKHIVKARKKIEQNLKNQEGTETEIDLIKLKVFEAQLDAMEQQASQIENQGLSALSFLVQAKNGEKVNIEDRPQELVDTRLDKLENYVQYALDHRPELEALRHGIAAHKAKVKFEKSNLIPDLKFVISMRWGYTPGVDFRQNIGTDANPVYDHSVPYLYQNRYNYSTVAPGIGLIMSYPLNFGVDAHKIKQAKADMQSIMMDNKYAVKGIILQVQNIYSQILSTKKQLDALGRAKKLAKGWLSAAIQNQAAGLGASKDVKDALKEYFGIMAQIHQKITEYNIALANLDKSTGFAEKKQVELN